MGRESATRVMQRRSPERKKVISQAAATVKEDGILKRWRNFSGVCVALLRNLVQLIRVDFN